MNKTNSKQKKRKPGSMLKIGAKVTFDKSGLDQLIVGLKSSGYHTVGPVVRDAAVMYGDIESCADLPEGYIDEQSEGKYRLKKTDSASLFGFTVGPDSLKKYLFPPRLSLYKTSRTKDGFSIENNSDPIVPLAAIGVRACDLKGVAIQDKVFLGGEYTDSDYAKRRAALFVVAVNCSRSVSTCFCTSMNAGPRVSELFDIALTEVINGDNHYFVAEIGSERGAELMVHANPIEADDLAVSTADKIVEATTAGITRRLETDGLAKILADNPEHPQWDDVAKRCINCGNCTMVCPTCFCTSIDDVTDLTGENAERVRRWDSCFTLDYSYIHGGSVRSSARGRYRQWLTHKLSSWHEQFDTSGCVGCGRCITWCPVGIDITAEATAIRESLFEEETIGQ